MKYTSQEEQFAQLVANGKNYSDALREIRPHVKKWKDKTVYSRASELASKVAGRVEELKKELAEKNLWSREQSVEVLKDVALHDEKGTARVSAIKELNAMHDFNPPKKHQQIGSDGQPVDPFPTRIEIVAKHDSCRD